MTNTGKPKRKKALLLGGIAIVLVLGIALLWAKPWIRPDKTMDWSTPPAGDRQITKTFSADGRITMVYEVPNKYDTAAIRVVPYTCFVRLDMDLRMELYNTKTDEEYDNVVLKTFVAELYDWNDPETLMKKVDVKRILEEKLPEYQPFTDGVGRGIYEGEVCLSFPVQPKYNGVPYVERPLALRNYYTSHETVGKQEFPVAVIKLESGEATLLPPYTVLPLDVELGVPEQDYSILSLLASKDYREEKGIPYILSFGEDVSQYSMLRVTDLAMIKTEWEKQGFPIYEIFPELYQLAQEDVNDVYFLFDSTVTPEEIMQLFMPEGVSWEPEGDYDY